MLFPVLFAELVPLLVLSPPLLFLQCFWCWLRSTFDDPEPSDAALFACCDPVDDRFSV